MVTVIKDMGQGPSAQGESTFSGTAWRDVAMPLTDGLSLGTNFFEPCARTHWHTHEGGQLLIIVAGGGFVGGDDGVHHVGVGDMIWTGPGERHWHGGGPERFLMHSTITLGGTTWLEPVSDADYRAASH